MRLRLLTNQLFTSLFGIALALSVVVACGDDDTDDSPVGGDDAGHSEHEDDHDHEHKDDHDHDDMDGGHEHDDDDHDDDDPDGGHDHDDDDPDGGHGHDDDDPDGGHGHDDDDPDGGHGRDDKDGGYDGGAAKADGGDAPKMDGGSGTDAGASAAHFKVIMLNMDGAEGAELFAISPDGKKLGGYAQVRVEGVAVEAAAIWTDDAREDVLPELGEGAGVLGFTREGLPLGYTTNAEGTDFIRYSGLIENGEWNVIPGLASPLQFGEARGGTNGVIAGYTKDADWNISEPFVWSEGTTTSLGSFGGENGQATGMNANGDIVGWSQTDDNGFVARGFVVPAGKTLDDAVRIDGLGGNTTFARAINAAGTVVGDGQTDDGKGGFIWSEGEGIKLIASPPEGGGQLIVRSINDAGEVVGDFRDADMQSLGWHWSEAEGLRQLDELVDLPSGSHVTRGWMIANDGSVASEVEDKDGNRLPAVLRPR